MKLKEVPKKLWPTMNNENLIKVYQNDTFLIQVFYIEGKTTRITVNRVDYISLNGKIHWKEGISWDELQEIKDSIGYEDQWLVECYPPQKHVINVANMRHLWVIQEPELFGWTND